MKRFIRANVVLPKRIDACFLFQLEIFIRGGFEVQKRRIGSKGRNCTDYFRSPFRTCTWHWMLLTDSIITCRSPSTAADRSTTLSHPLDVAYVLSKTLMEDLSLGPLYLSFLVKTLGSFARPWWLFVHPSMCLRTSLIMCFSEDVPPGAPFDPLLSDISPIKPGTDPRGSPIKRVEFRVHKEWGVEQTERVQPRPQWCRVAGRLWTRSRLCHDHPRGRNIGWEHLPRHGDV